LALSFCNTALENAQLLRVSLRLKGRQVSFNGTVCTKEITMLKFLVVGIASLALVGSAAAADLPHPQPVYQQAPIGKAPIGKYPVGKYPIGKAPAAAPLVTKS
jgi:hypothetical protein